MIFRNIIEKFCEEFKCCLDNSKLILIGLPKILILTIYFLKVFLLIDLSIVLEEDNSIYDRETHEEIPSYNEQQADHFRSSVSVFKFFLNSLTVYQSHFQS